jgi:hypothetical protein
MNITLHRNNDSRPDTTHETREAALDVLCPEFPEAVTYDVDGEKGRVLVFRSLEEMEADGEPVAELLGGTLHPSDAERIERRYEARGESAQSEDADDADQKPPTCRDDIDEGMLAQHLGLDDGGREAEMLREEHGPLGDAAVEAAREAALRGYLRAWGL